MLRPRPEDEMSYLSICLADPIRIEMIRILATEPDVGVTDMALKMGRSQPNVSQHLAMLRRHGMIRAIRKGTSVTHYIDNPRILWWLEGLMRAWMSAPGTKEASGYRYRLAGHQPAFTKGII